MVQILNWYRRRLRGVLAQGRRRRTAVNGHGRGEACLVDAGVDAGIDVSAVDGEAAAQEVAHGAAVGTRWVVHGGRGAHDGGAATQVTHGEIAADRRAPLLLLVVEELVRVRVGGLKREARLHSCGNSK